MKRLRTVGLCLVLATAASARVIAQESGSSGLSPSERSRLHALGFAVIPAPLPPGFEIKGVHVDAGGRAYRVEYVRPRDGATMVFSGSAAAAGKGAPKKHHGFFTSIASTIGGIGHTAQTGTSSLRSTSSEQVTPEEEQKQEMTAVESDSALTGPIHFQTDKGCLSGSPESSKALIQSAHFTVRACSMRQPDPLIRAYKSVVRV